MAPHSLTSQDHVASSVAGPSGLRTTAIVLEPPSVSLHGLCVFVGFTGFGECLDHPPTRSVSEAGSGISILDRGAIRTSALVAVWSGIALGWRFGGVRSNMYRVNEQLEQAPFMSRPLQVTKLFRVDGGLGMGGSGDP